jgi:DisA bacterial checkpoint controller nucleotide-binding
MSKYPNDLAKELLMRWPRVQRSEAGNFPKLPAIEILTNLFDVSFNASLQTEEQRRIRFRWILCSYKQLIKSQEQSARSFYEPIRFEQPLPFSEAQIHRLSPEIDLTTSLIGIEESEQGLRIWGLIHAGSSWWKFVRGAWTAADVFPEDPLPFLTLSSMRPGELSISCDGFVLLILADGKVSTPSGDLLFEASSPLSNFFDKARRALVEELYDKAHGDRLFLLSDIPARNTYGIVLRNILSKVQDQDHGGSLIFVSDDLSAEDARLKEFLNIKYAAQFSRIWGALRDLFLIHSRTTKLYESVDSSSLTARQEAVKQIEKLCVTHQLLVTTLEDAAHFIASLTAVDGAVVITDKYRVLGFGAEVKIPKSKLTQVMLVEDKKRYKVQIDSYGTRHRSAFRFCHAFKESVVFIVSQDGDVRGTTSVNGKVMLWNNIIRASDYGMGFTLP